MKNATHSDGEENELRPMPPMKMKRKRKVLSVVLVSQSYSQERKNPLIKGCNCLVI